MTRITDLLKKRCFPESLRQGEQQGSITAGATSVPSLNLSSWNYFGSIEELSSYHANKFDSFRYARDSSQLIRQMELLFGEMYNSYETLLFGSGMAALSACFEVLVSKDTRVVTLGSYYRKSQAIFEDLKRRYNISTFNYTSIDDLLAAVVNDSNVLILLESPSNPFLRVYDIKKLRERLPDAKIIYDVTFQGLMNGQELYEYADYVVTSLTKYVSGHDDFLGGLVACKAGPAYSKCWDQRSMRGGILDNFSAYLLHRSLRTYDLRMECALRSVEQIMKFLESAPQIKEIFYPGRYANATDCPVFSRYFSHGGSVITFRVNPNVALGKNLRRLKITKMAPSFGSVDTLFEIPASMSHWGKSDEELASLGLDQFTVRYSVGTEPVDLLIEDLQLLIG